MKRQIFLLLALASLCSALGSIIEPKEPAILEVTYDKVTNLDTLNRAKKNYYFRRDETENRENILYVLSP